MKATGSSTWSGTWREGGGSISTDGTTLRRAPFSFALGAVLGASVGGSFVVAAGMGGVLWSGWLFTGSTLLRVLERLWLAKRPKISLRPT